MAAMVGWIGGLVLYEPSILAGQEPANAQIFARLERLIEGDICKVAPVTFFREVLKVPESQNEDLRAHRAWPGCGGTHCGARRPVGHPLQVEPGPLQRNPDVDAARAGWRQPHVPERRRQAFGDRPAQEPGPRHARPAARGDGSYPRGVRRGGAVFRPGASNVMVRQARGLWAQPHRTRAG